MKYYTVNDLKSSRIQYDKNPPKLFIYVILFTLILIISLCTLASLTYKTEVVRTSGIFESENKTNIQSSTSGQITKIYHYSNDFVEKDTLLFELDSTQLTASIIALNGKIDYMNNYISKYNQLISSIEALDVVNLDNINNPFEKNEFYYLYETVINAIKDTEVNEYMSITLEQARNKTKNQYIQSFYQSKVQYEYDLIGNKSQVEAYDDMLKSYKVYAPVDGYINYNSDLKVGNVIDSSVIGSISEKITEDNSLIYCYVNNANRSFINIEDDTEVIVNGLSQSKYGTISGKVISVSSDVVTDNEGNVLFKVGIKPNSIKLKDINMVNGQVSEIRIKYDSITWMNWMLKKIGIIDR